MQELENSARMSSTSFITYIFYFNIFLTLKLHSPLVITRSKGPEKIPATTGVAS